MSEHQHLTRSQYLQLIRGEIPPRQLIHRLFQHLLERCPTCQQEWREYCEDQHHQPDLLGPKELELKKPAPRGGTKIESSAGDSIFDGPVDRAVQQVGRLRRQIEKDRQEAPNLLRQLMALPALEQRITRVRRSERYRNWALCDVLLVKSREAAFLSHRLAEDLAQLAIEATSMLEPTHHQQGIYHDLLARGWAYLANARRIRSRLPQADETFLMARYFLDQGSGDPLVAGEILSLEASLRRDQRRFDTALEVLDLAVRLFEVAGEEHLQGRALLKKGTVLEEMARVNDALRVSDQALSLIDATREPYLNLCARHGAVRLLNLTGRSQEAATALEKIRPLYRRFLQPLTELRLAWLEAEIAEGLGDLDEAVAAYREVREGFLELEIPYDAALASLSLIGIYRRQGRFQELRGLAEEMLLTFHQQEVHREIIATWKVLRDAATAEKVSTSLLRQLGEHFKRARRHPALEFQAGGS